MIITFGFKTMLQWSPSKKASQNWLKDNVVDFIPANEWPGNSPDFNPIEDIWGIIMQQKVDMHYNHKLCQS